MTGDQLHAAALELVERSTAEQGLPLYLEDSTTLARVARILAGRGEAPATHRGPTNRQHHERTERVARQR